MNYIPILKTALAALLTIQILAPTAAEAQVDLFVEFSASPSSGSAPLENVDLTAAVSGTATGPITYKFDCTSNGSWERTVTTNNTSYTAENLCDYSAAGNYVAKISVERAGLFFEGTTAIMVNGGRDLAVHLSASPSSGIAPLESVDLEVSVSGNSNGSITYRFDCTSNGSWEKTHTTNSSTHTAQNLCDYDDPGSYTARVKVERDGLSFEGTATVAVFSTNEEIGESVRVTKLARNASRGETNWQNSALASPDEDIEFRVEVRNTGNERVENAVLSDILPGQMTYEDDLRRNGNSVSGDIRDGISLGNLEPNEREIVTFSVRVNAAENFAFGTTTLTNTAVVRGASGLVQVGTVKVLVQRTSVLGATSVNTGVTEYLAALLGLLFAASVLLYAAWMRLVYSQNAFARGFVRKAYLWASFVMTR